MLFGEVAIGATLYPFFSFWGLAVVIPLYGLHTLILASVVYRFGRPRFETLYLAGIVFGLYEAYITKVIWNPEWESPLHVGGIGVFEVLVLVFFWHPFMSFIIPLGVAELLTSGRRLLPDFVVRKPYVFALLLGALESSNSPTPWHSLLSTASTLGVILLLIHLWRGRYYTGEDMEDLLPTPGELRFLLPVLLTYYIVLTLGIKGTAIPGMGPQAFVWLIYAATFYLLHRALAKSKGFETGRFNCKPTMGKLVRFSALFVLSSGIFSTIEPPFHELKYLIIVALWLFASFVGALSFLRSARWALTR